MRRGGGIYDRRTLRKFVLLSCAIVLLFFFGATYWSLEKKVSTVQVISPKREGPVVSSKCSPLEIQNDNQGFIDVPTESTILMLFSPTSSGLYCHTPSVGELVEEKNSSSSCAANMRRVFERSFQKAGAAFVTDYRLPQAPFFDFFRAHSPTYWEVDEDGVARPLLLDIVYTYVNPLAPSMQRNLEARGLSDRTERRYTDWDELRYSFRGLHQFVLGNPLLRQTVAQLQEDIEFLRELGLTVPDDVIMKADLLNDVILLLAHEDQVPEWLNTTMFPQLKVITHRSMFSSPNESFILPTLNSNVIEGGIHRIPGISKFYLYVNNDMFVSRNITIFDMFRPLSPPRQELHFTAMVSKWGTSLESLQHCKLSTEKRTILFLEPILHNFGDEVEYVPSFDQKENASLAASCIFDKGKETLKYMLKEGRGGKDNMYTDNIAALSTVSGLDSRKALGFPFPFFFGTCPGCGVSLKWYLSLLRNKVNGFDAPSGFAHIPHIFNREVAHAINEVDLFEFSNATRAAFIREMFPFSTVDLYVGFALGMVRGRERYMWNQIWQNVLPNITVAENRVGLQFPWIEDVAKLIVEKGLSDHQIRPLSSKKLRVADCGPLYGPGTQVMLQSPRLFEELVLWWDPALRPAAGDGEDSKWLKTLYAFPSIQSHGDNMGSNSNEGKGAIHSCADTTLIPHPTLPEQFKLLYQDARAYLGSTPTYRFEMLEGGLKPLAVLGRLREDEIRHTIPLWMNLNDNYHSTGKEKDELIQKGLFKVLMFILSNRTRPAPWEANEKSIS